MSRAPALSPSADVKFAELRATDCHPAMRAELERIIREGSDIDCYKLNVVRLANDLDLPVRDCLRTLLFATQLGILDLNYDLYCPSCQGNTEYARHLMGLHKTGHCNLCVLDFNLDFLEQIEVTFTVNDNVRKIAVVDFRDRDFEGKVEYFQQVMEREGRRPHLSQWLQPETEVVVTQELDGHPDGFLFYMGSHPDQGGVMTIVGERTTEVQHRAVTIAESGAVSPTELNLQPGPIELVITSKYRKPWPFLVMKRGFPNYWMSAAYVTIQQDFRDLFAGEFLAPGVSFAIRNATLLFTDIKQSTEMFEELGDSAAYALVQDHFAVMADIIRSWEGGVVKTIGDAVMAAFPVNRNAVGAACEIQKAFAQAPIKNRFIQVKLGLHRGPTIMVTSNRCLDYFGRTVNIAARVQGKSGANQVLLSTTVMDDPEVAALLAERAVTTTSFTTELKGLGDRFQLYAVDRSS